MTDRLASNGVFQFSEPVLVTYIDLDRLIQMADLTKTEMRIVYFLMDGYSIPDIAQRYGKVRQVIDRVLNAAVQKICETEQRIWKKTYC